MPRTNKVDSSNTNKALRTQLRSANGELEATRAELKALREVAAVTDPTALTRGLPDVVTRWSDDFGPSILAMGMVGKGPDEVRAAIGIPFKLWSDWHANRPGFASLCDRYASLVRAYWLEQCRNAIAANSWSFSMDKVERILDAMFKREPGADTRGDASTLVMVDAVSMECPHCGSIVTPSA